MVDDPKRPKDASSSSDAQTPESPVAAENRNSPRVDDKSPSPGREMKDAGNLPPPPGDAQAVPPTPESQAALTGKAPSGSSRSGTTVPASSGDAAQQRTPLKDEANAIGPQPPGGASPSIGDPLKNPSQSDAEKATKIAEAKARAAATKQAAGDKPSPPQPAGGAAAAAGGGAGAPKAPVKKKEEGPKPTEAMNHPLAKRLGEMAGGAVLEATEFIGQLSIRIEPSRLVEVCELLKHDAETPFNYLTDVTCVHLPDRFEAPFELVYNLYSIQGNVRVRLKVAADEQKGVESVTGLWPTANWMEREVFDLFGIPFQNHPDLRRILLPPDWEGHPLRKDYPLEFMENNWTTKHLPEFTEVQQEQLVQRRAYGLEMLHVPAERQVREIFRAGKEVMPKDK
jgi:NADH-quinone oxidoreductase subunit C